MFYNLSFNRQTRINIYAAVNFDKLKTVFTAVPHKSDEKSHERRASCEQREFLSIKYSY